jgi:hypothetical protein
VRAQRAPSGLIHAWHVARAVAKLEIRPHLGPHLLQEFRHARAGRVL